ncbi:MAG: hypothetical protein ACK58L_02490, partial [Planctomycetota bacterium]
IMGGNESGNSDDDDSSSICSGDSGCSGDDGYEAEIHDAVGEMVSIIGGNLREKTEGASRLSLPCVSQRSVDGLCSHFFVGWSVANRCRGGLLIVRLLDFHAAGSVTLS